MLPAYPRTPKVDDDNFSFGVLHDVARMEVVVDNAIVMDLVETSENIGLVLPWAVQANARKLLHAEAKTTVLVDEGF